ncbi:HYR domain-containing protein [Flavobacterium ovatum]|uniref:HYR domain-containing protein n=1 Tax=Flavobacterium ovatum TaxID=1928857 RepID=UPI00344B06A8
MKQKYFLIIILFLSFLISYSQVTGDFRSKSPTNTNWTAIASWETYNGSAWVNATVYPGQNAGSYTVTILTGDIITIATNLTTTTMGQVIVYGTLNLSPAGSPNTITLSTTTLDINGGALNFNLTKVRLNLPTSAVITLENGGNFTGQCNNNDEIYIGTTRYAACVGGGSSVYTFGEVAASGGNVNAQITNPAADPVASSACTTVNLTGGYTGTETNVTYKWNLRDPNGTTTTITSGTLTNSSQTTATSFSPLIIGQYLVSLEVTTASLATNIETRTINVGVDIETPTISCPTNITQNVGAASCTASVITPNPTTGDNCTVTKLTWTLTGVTTGASATTGINNIGTTTFNLGITTITYRAEDAAGNFATCSYTVTVADNINPTISCPANITQNVGAASCTASVITPNPTTGDNCAVTKLTWSLTGVTTGASAATGINNIGTQIFNLGATTVTYRAEDAAGNFATCSYTVTVADNINPTISCPANITQNVGAASCTASVITPNPTTGDNCAVTKLTWSLTGVTTGASAATGINNIGTRTFNLGTTTVTYRAEDAASNFATCSYTVTVTDNINPTISCPANITQNVGAASCTASVITPNPTTGDNCTVTKLTWTLTGVTSGASVATGINNIGTRTFNLGTTTVTYRDEDAAGNFATCSYTVTVTDNINPTISCPANITQNVGAASCTASVITPNPTTGDNCAVTKLTWSLTGVTTGASAVTGINNIGTQIFNLGATTVTYRAEDAAGNFATCSYTVTVADNINPTISCPANITQNVGAASCTASVITPNPTTGDNCAVTKLTWSLTGVTTGASATTGINNIGTQTFNLGATTVTYRAEDAAGNFATCSYTVTVTDNINPTISCPANITQNVGAASCTASVITPNPTSADNCAVTKLTWSLTGVTTGASAATGINNIGTQIFNLGATTVTYRAEDAAGNFATCSYTVTVTDNINPTISCPANITQNVGAASCTASVITPNPTTGDNCAVTKLTWTLTGATTGSSATTGINNIGTQTFNLGATTVTYRAEDAAGNFATCSYTVTVTDNINPTISCPANITQNVGAASCTASVITPNPTTGDNCAVTKLTWTLTGATTGSSATTGINNIGTQTFNLGATTVTYRAEDAAGNFATCSYTVTVTDNINPTISCPANITQNVGAASCTASVITPNPTTGDNCAVTKLTWSLTGVTTGASAATGINNIGTQIFNLGATTVTYRAEDAAGNFATCSYTVTVADNINPTISCPANITQNVGAASCTASVITPNPTTGDNCTVTKLTWTLTGVTTGASATTGINNIGTQTFNLGATTVTYRAEDAAGNFATCSYTVTVTDNINPTISCPANITQNVGAASCTASVITPNPTSADNCAVTKLTWSLTGVTTGSSVATGINNIGTRTFNLGTTTVTYRAEDAAGNFATCSYTVTVADNINPTISCPANITQNVGAASCTASVITPNPTTGDNCTVTKLTWTLTGVTTGASATTGINNIGTRTFNLGTTTVTYRAEDAASNFATCSYTVTVTDNINPTISCPANITQNVGAASCTASVITPNPTTGDNCTVTKLTWTLTGVTSGASVATGINNIGTRTFNLGTTTVTYRDEDAAGNFATCSYTVTVTDNINPTINPPSNITTTVAAGTCTKSVATISPTVSDNCAVTKLTWTMTGATTANSLATGINNIGTYSFNLGTTTVTYNVFDAAGNTATSFYTVTVTDNINPTISCSANLSQNVDAGNCAASVITPSPTTADNCAVTKLTWSLTGVTTGSSVATGINNIGTRTFNLGTTTVTYRAEDAAGNFATCSYTVTVTDNINPTISCPANITQNVGAASCTASVITPNPTTGDNCAVTKLTWSLTGVTTGASATTGINNIGTRTFNLGTTTVTYRAEDAAGNFATCSYTVTVTDNINPTINPPSNITTTVAAGTCTKSVATISPTVSDNCAVTKLTWTMTGATTANSLATGINNIGTYSFNLGTTTVTYNVFDAAGNTATSFYTVTVTDNINPTISCSANLSKNVDAGNCAASVITPSPTTADNCAITKLTWSLTGVTTGSSVATGINNIGTRTFNLGTTTVTYRAEDAAGNFATCSYTVTVTDNINPTISCPANITQNVGAASCTASVITPNPTTGDNCAVTKLTWSLTGVTTGASATTGINNIGTRTFNLGTTTVTYRAEDAAGNFATCSYTVTVTDNINPSLAPGLDQSANTATGLCTASVNVTNAIYSDNCTVTSFTYSLGGATTKSTTSNQVGTYTFNKGITLITYTVIDNSGNITTGTKTITVIDNQKPNVPTLTSINAQCSITVPPPTTPDNCDGTITATTSDNTVFTNQGTFSIVWSFKDSSNNETIATQSVVINDTTAPVPNVTNLPNNNISGCQIDSLTPPTATDNCSGTLNGVPNISFPFTKQGTTVITWTYTDAKGNIKTQNQNLTLTSPPISGGTLKGYLSDIYTTADATDNIAITSCPDDTNPIKIDLTGETGTIVQWEKFEAGNTSWEVIPNTTNSYNITFNYTNTKSTLFRVLVQVGSCTRYSNMVNVHAIPPDVPPILEQNDFTICLNDPVTLIAHNGYNSASNVDDGGDFNNGQFPNKWDPTQWKIDGQTAGAQWTASGNNTKFNNWSGTNNHPVGTNYRIEYDSNDFKFGIAHGNYNSAGYKAAFPPGNPTRLETPIFSLVGLQTASVDFDQAFNLHAGDIAKLELSLDGGTTYTITLQDLIGTSPHALSWGDTHGAPVPYPYVAPGNNGKPVTKFNFQNDNSSFDISNYIGNDSVRVRWTFFGTTDESAWAIDNISIPVRPYSDQLEWTDGLGDPGEPPLASGTIDVAYTFVPSSPGVHQYGATSLINGCRAYDPDGTAIADVKVNYSYAGTNITPIPGNCGGNSASLNAYDNRLTAVQNKANGSYPRDLDNFSDDPGTQAGGTWSIVNGPGNACGIGNFSPNVNDPKATFTGAAGTYTLKWKVATCEALVQVTLANCNVIDFDGQDDFVNFRNNYNLSSSFSIGVWVKPEPQSTPPNNIKSILTKRNGDNLSSPNGYDLRLDSNNYISFNWNNGGNISSPYPINTSRWYHVAVTFDGTTYKLYLDGIEVNSTTGSAPITNNNNCLLGAMDRNGNPNQPINYYKGWIDEIRIWNTAINKDQLHQMMNQEVNSNGAMVRGTIIPIDVNGLTWANLIGYYRMDDLNCGYLRPFAGKGVDGRLFNINTSQQETAPLPYTTIRNGNWKDRGASTTPWLYGSSVWDYPNSTGVNGDPIDWNIVVNSNNLNNDDKDISLLGFIMNTGTELIVTAPGIQDETNSGHMLWITHYLKLNGFIDLIGESQLIQKRYYSYPTQYSESIFEETSTGYIERDQQGKKNSFNYNYWTSPVSIRGAANNSPYTLNGVLKDGTVSSSPKNISFVTTAFAADGPVESPIKISTRWIWSYNSKTLASNSELQNYYLWNHIYNYGSLNTGEGFTMKGTGGTAPLTVTQNYVFTGKPNSGTITLGLPLEQTYLVGNPYPSALDADEFIKDNLKDCATCRGTANTFNGALYFWDHLGITANHILAEYEGGYATYTLMGGTIARVNGDLNSQSGNQGTKAPGRYIPVAQGFFVDAALETSIIGSTTSVQGGPLVFKNNQRAFYREGNNNSTFMKPGVSGKTKESNEIKIDLRPKIRLGYNSATGKYRQLLVGSDKNTTQQFDLGYDAPMFDMNDDDLYWIIKNSPFVIQGVPNFEDDQIIPLGISISKAGLSTIKIDNLENISNDLNIFIYDKETDQYHDLRTSGFSIMLPTGKYTNRFSLRFEKDILPSTEENSLKEGVKIYFSKESYSININNYIENDIVKKVTLFNSLGQIIKTWEIDKSNQETIQLPIKKVSSGVYIVKTKTNQGSFDTKIIIN